MHGWVDGRVGSRSVDNAAAPPQVGPPLPPSPSPRGELVGVSLHEKELWRFPRVPAAIVEGLFPIQR